MAPTTFILKILVAIVLIVVVAWGLPGFIGPEPAVLPYCLLCVFVGIGPTYVAERMGKRREWDNGLRRIGFCILGCPADQIENMSSGCGYRVATARLILVMIGFASGTLAGRIMMNLSLQMSGPLRFTYLVLAEISCIVTIGLLCRIIRPWKIVNAPSNSSNAGNSSVRLRQH